MLEIDKGQSYHVRKVGFWSRCRAEIGFLMSRSNCPWETSDARFQYHCANERQGMKVGNSGLKMPMPVKSSVRSGIRPSTAKSHMEVFTQRASTQSIQSRAR